jgi:ankyrin
VANGADSIKSNNSNATALHIASGGGHFQIVEFLLSLKKAVNQPDIEGRTPLHLAIRSGSSAIVKMLLSAGCDRGATDKNGWSCLHFASYYGHTNLVEFFLGKGLDATQGTTDNGSTPRDMASRRGYSSIVEKLLVAEQREENSRKRKSSPEPPQPLPKAPKKSLEDKRNLL